MIRARDLTRTFVHQPPRGHRGRGTPTSLTAVAGIDLDVAEGEVAGLLGPNGAGKTTTLRMLCTLLAPTAGEAIVAGADLRTEAATVRRRIGYVGQRGGTDPNAIVAHELELQGRLYGLTKPAAQARARALSEQLDLSAFVTQPIRTLSGGQRRRLDIALGLVHQPRVLFLDEPSTGLDPHSRAQLWDHVRAVRLTGTTVLLTTHYLDEADALCDRVLILDRGTIIAEDTPAALKRRSAGDTILVGVAPAELDRARAAASQVPDVRVTTDGEHLHLRTTDVATALPALLRRLGAEQIKMHSLEVRRPSLEDVFLQLTRAEASDRQTLTEPAPTRGSEGS